MTCYEIIHGSLMAQIKSLDKEITSRGNDLSPSEAKVFYDNLNALSDQLVSNRIYLEQNIQDWESLTEILRISRQIHQQSILLQAKLSKIIETKPTAIDTSFSRSSQSIALDTLLHKQRFLQERISSLESKFDSSCPIRAEILYNHITQIFACFVANQTEIEKHSSDFVLCSQLETFAEIEDKVIQMQTKFKKIFTPDTSTSSNKSGIAKPDTSKSLFGLIGFGISAFLDYVRNLMRFPVSLISRK